MKDTRAALKWIVEELLQRGIPFAIVGGLAVNAYGGTRPLNDIDIDIPDMALAQLARDLKPYLSFELEHSMSECFDCQLFGISYLGQEIELGGAESLLIRDSSSRQWKPWPTDLTAVEQREVFGVEVPVISFDRLIAYKRLAGRDLDKMDVAELEKMPRHLKSNGP